jgi:hypothetical protein
MAGEDDGHTQARQLGELIGAYKAVDNRLVDMQRFMERSDAKAAESRQRMHDKIDVAKTDLAAVASRLRIVEQWQEYFNTQSKLYATVSAVDALSDAQAEMEKSVRALTSIKDKVHGAWRATVFIASSIGALVGAIAIEAWRYFMGRGTP